MKQRLMTLMIAALSAISLNAQQTTLEEITQNRFLCASNYLDYDNYPATEKLTKTPKGYEIYYLSHYGRHGSRWLLNETAPQSKGTRKDYINRRRSAS